MDDGCGLSGAQLNGTHIDVVSMDVYWKTFESGLQAYYDWLSTHRSSGGQQLALVPGTFFRAGVDDQATQASLFQGFFDYANIQNTWCDKPLGATGVTGHVDGCLVWLVAGWPAKIGNVDSLLTGEVPNRGTITGWATDRNAPGNPGYIDFWIDGNVYAGETRASAERSDVAITNGKWAATIGMPCCENVFLSSGDIWTVIIIVVWALEILSRWKIADALNMFSGSMSLCVQSVTLACDAGHIEIGEHVIAMTADTSILATASKSGGIEAAGRSRTKLF